MESFVTLKKERETTVYLKLSQNGSNLGYVKLSQSETVTCSLCLYGAQHVYMLSEFNEYY